MDEKDIKKILSTDLSESTEAFRDELLKRCLDLLPSDDGSFELVDADLELLAAAGDANSPRREPHDQNADKPQ